MKFPIIYLLLFTMLLSSTVLNAKQIIPLNKDWKFKANSAKEWQKAVVPGVVHLDLLRNGKIEDPYVGNNELAQNWIEKEDWTYVTRIKIDEKLLKNKHIDLVFEGLDTYTSILVNRYEVLTTDNMFRKWKVNIVDYLTPGDNEIQVIFQSPINKNRKKVRDASYELPAANETVNMKVSPYTRKAAYQFGWDWGPRFVTAGIWKPAYLEVWNDINVLDASYEVKDSTETEYAINFNFEIQSKADKILQLKLNNDETVLHIKKGTHIVNHQLLVRKADILLWNPVGYGRRTFYRYNYTLSEQNKEVKSGEFNVAFRKIELIQEKDQLGTGFYFKVNGYPFYAKGANYVPQDLFLTRVDSAKYERIIQQALDANMNMLRVWGGGIYENDYFYDLCDQHGILVWQDFMFANSMYPNDECFIDNVRSEVVDNVKRLRNHPCIAVWCGNNEIEVAWNNWGWQEKFNYTEAQETEIWTNYERIFHQIIPNTLQQLNPQAAYVPTTPLINWGTPENFNHSSMHYWGVWHGKEPIENFSKNVGRFMAEYGYQSFPSYETLEKVINKEDLHLSSAVMKNRQKSYIGNGIIEENVLKYAYLEKDFKKWCELTQQVQAHAYGYAIRQHRIKTPHCMGTLFWQLNDCWPGPSWSVIDYYGNEKLAYGEVKKHYEPVIASPVIDEQGLKITLVSDSIRIVKVNLSVTITTHKGDIIPLLNTDRLLGYLKPLKILKVLPNKILRWLAKDKISHFNINVTNEKGEPLFESKYYPNDNATVAFSKE